MTRAMRVAVVGGGPAGLCTLKFLATAHRFFPIPALEVRLFESEAEIGGTFVYRIYEDAEMVSSRYLTLFSDFRPARDAPDFLKPQAFVQYLHDYVDAFGVRDNIELKTKVTNISRGEGGLGHVIEIAKEDGRVSTWNCDAVAVCSGIHVWPQIPTIPGIERVPSYFHSNKMKSRAQFDKDTNVVVLGCGETGMDIAHLAVTSPTKSVTLCHRDGFFCAPKIIPVPSVFGSKIPARPNKPVDTSVASLFDTAYAHPILQKSPLLWFAYDQWIKKVHWLVSGTEEGPDQWVGHISKQRKNVGSIFLCKSARALPYISAGQRSTSLVNRIRSSIINVPMKETNGRHIDVKRWPLRVDDKGFMHFDGLEPSDPVKADVVVFATGYTTNFPFLSPKQYPDLDDLDVRGVYKQGDTTVGYIGFVRPSIGAIPPLAELQAQLWVHRLLLERFPNQVPAGLDPDAVQPYEVDYLLQPRCGYDFAITKRGVDHEAYAYQLALDIGAAPKISYVVRKGWKLFFTWAMGSNFNPKFRMVGPWKWEAGAEDIMRGELYDVVKRSGGLFYLTTYTIIPFVVFGAVSVLLYAVTGMLSLPINLCRWTISLGKYGSFPSNLIIERPYHLTYEIQDKRDGESFSRLRVVPGTELNADKLADLSADMNEELAEEGDDVIEAENGEELTLVDESGKVIARSTREIIDENARQTLTTEEIEELKRNGTSAGKDLIAKLMLSHTAIDQKTAYSLAKYKLLKEKKYMRRFTVLPLDVAQLAHWMLVERDASKVMEIRQEMIGLLGCWADVHFGGLPMDGEKGAHGGRWLAVDDTGGLLVAAMAERMGILYQEPEEEVTDAKDPHGEQSKQESGHAQEEIEAHTQADAMETQENGSAAEATNEQPPSSPKAQRNPRKRPRRDDLDDHYALTNTITVLHSNPQPNLALLRHYDFDAFDPNPPQPYHPLFTHLLPISWLQLLEPELDVVYADEAPQATSDELASWKTNRRANYHRKRRRWARTRQIVDTTRAGGFSGLAIASSMDPISILRHTLPLLAGGAPIAIYSPTVEPLTQLADCFSIGRRGAWVANPPPEAEGKTTAELDQWAGTAEYPLNPSLLIGAGVQTSRATRWQVLPGRTHPFMTEKGGASGYIFTGWRAIPAEGRIAARGKFHKKRD
ncbi:Monooxygenase ptmN [Cladobotryum mycophilum]|uniref:tRNA (adenine(58)-N(1))-methyltransferase non-catalytic subunit TRM6 n=1 Tax=Cladobotryum mycophilum TaxID=491253 RepID=A0ABR0T182_9HYPO